MESSNCFRSASLFVPVSPFFSYRSSVATSQIKENWFNSKCKTINVRSGFRWQSPFDRIQCNLMYRKQNPFNLVKLSSLWHDSYEECVCVSVSSFSHIFSLKQQRWANSFKQIYYRWMAQLAHSLSLHPSNCEQNGTEEKWMEEWNSDVIRCILCEQLNKYACTQAYPYDIIIIICTTALMYKVVERGRHHKSCDLNSRR